MDKNNKIKEANILTYDNETKKKFHWNPYEENIDVTLFNNISNIYILGPFQITGDLQNEKYRYLWRFSLVKRNNDIILSSFVNSFDESPCIKIFIKKNIGEIKYVHTCDEYSGKNIIEWSIKIMEKLGCEKCILVDMAEKKCENRNFNNYVSLSLIHKLWRNKTYYEEFDFHPYHKNNTEYKTNKNNELNNKVAELKQISWDEYTNSMNNEKWIQFRNLYDEIYKSPFSAFAQFKPKNCSIFYDILYFLDNPYQPSFRLLSEIKSIISKSVWMKKL